MSIEKVGLHINGTSDVDLTGCPCLTLVNPSVEFVHHCLDATHWRAKIIVRWNENKQDVIWHHNMEHMPKHENIVFQGLNERVVSGGQDAYLWMLEERARMKALHAQGRHAALLVPSMGTYEGDEWMAMEAIVSDMGPHDVVAIHEYWPRESDITDPERWFCGRWTRFAPWLYRRDVPVIISEMGRDSAPGQGLGWSGWLRVPGLTVGRYVAEIELYSAMHMVPWPNVIGGTVFTVGNDSRWDDFNVREPVWDMIQARRSVAVPVPPPLTPPEPAQPSCEEVRALLLEFANHAQEQGEIGYRRAQAWKAQAEELYALANRMKCSGG